MLGRFSDFTVWSAVVLPVLFLVLLLVEQEPKMPKGPQQGTYTSEGSELHIEDVEFSALRL